MRLLLLLFACVFTATAFGDEHVRPGAAGSAPSARRGNAGKPACFEPDKDRHEDCSNPGRFIEDILKTANGQTEISGILSALKLPSGSVVAANTSFSVQQSPGTYNHRLYVQTQCGTPDFPAPGIDFGAKHLPSIR